MADPGFPRGGSPTPQRGVPTYDFVKVSQKLHEIERIWTPRGGGGGGEWWGSLASPLDQPVIVQCYKFIGYFCMLQKCFLKDTNVKTKLEVSDLFEKIQISFRVIALKTVHFYVSSAGVWAKEWQVRVLMLEWTRKRLHEQRICQSEIIINRLHIHFLL